MSETTMHSFRCRYCNESHATGEPNAPCNGGHELRIAAEALARVAYVTSDPPRVFVHAPEWHVSVDPTTDARTYSITMVPE